MSVQFGLPVLDSEVRCEAAAVDFRRLLQVALLSLTFAEVAHAAETEQALSDLSEIIVTATKRPVGVQRLPEAVTAITSQRLDQLNALTFEDYFRDVPGLMLNMDDSGRFDFSIRGASDFSASIPQATATVGQYVDEIPVTSTGAQLDMRLVDIDRIEVLRGPQGTYYGEGSVGGTIRIITKHPDLDHWYSNAEARGSHTRNGGINHQESLTVNAPLVAGKLAFRASYFNAADSGFIDVVNVTGTPTATILGNYKDRNNSSAADGGRGTLRFEPIESLSILAEVIHTRTRSDGIRGFDPTVGDLLGTITCPSSSTPPTCYDSRETQTVDLYNLTVNADLGWASLVSASSWTATERNLDNFPAAPNQIARRDDLTDGDAFAQEVRLVSSEKWSQRWDYVVGAFDNRKHSLDVGVAGVPLGPVPLDFTTRETALFGELGYKLDRHLSARLGIRNVELKQEQTMSLPLAGGGYNVKNADAKYTPVTGRAMLNYAFDEDAMIYASVSTGFREGGANLPSPNPAITIPATYEPDKAKNYELGWKLSFPAHRAIFNGAVYHIDWNNIQTAGLIYVNGRPAFEYRQNAGNAVVDGLELEGSLKLLENLTLRGTASFIDARLSEDYNFSINPLVQHGAKGDRIPFVAPLSGSLSMDYRRSLGKVAASGFGILNAQYQSSRHSDFNPVLDSPPNAASASYAVMPAYTVVGLQVGVENDQWRIACYVDNLFDTRAALFRIPGAVAGHFIELPNRPRTIGLFLRRTFD